MYYVVSLLLVLTPITLASIPPVKSLHTIVMEQDLKDKNLIRAIIDQESDWKVDAKRYEKSCKCYSLGIMQVRYTTAQMMGFKGTEDELMQPEINIKYGVAYLKYQLRRYKNNKFDAIAAYNAGSVIRKNNYYINQQYVDEVMINYLLRNRKL